MKIYVPVPAFFYRCRDWSDVVVWRWRRFDLSRGEIIIGGLSLVVVAYYAWAGGWRGGAIAMLAWLMGAMVGLWIL